MLVTYASTGTYLTDEWGTGEDQKKVEKDEWFGGWVGGSQKGTYSRQKALVWGRRGKGIHQRVALKRTTKDYCG